MEKVIATADIGATNITTTLCNRDGILVRLYQKVILEGEDTAVPDQIKSMIDMCLSEAGKDLVDLKAVGISSAGPFRMVDGMIEVICHNICGGINPGRGSIPNDWASIPLERELKEHYENIKILNDAVAGAVAERTFGSGIGIDDLLYVTWSTGIGTGAYVDGRLIRGKNGNAPHGGHVYVGEKGPVCGCGNICDLESVASGTAIALEYGENSSTAEVFDAYHRGDEKARRVIENAAVSFGKGIASINCILDTRLIAIGGSVFLNHKNLLLPMVKDEFFRSFPAMSGEVEITPTELGKYLGDVAAISLVIPEDWIEHWRNIKPWERAPETINLD
jgi:glucokinase